MAYVYRHIREDKQEPFYIGIGGDSDYKRASTNLGRNKYWQNVAKKTNWYFEILTDDISWEFACQKEKEFISIYKRKRDGGVLCNLTLGGEGQLGMTPWNFGKETPKETRKKQSEKKIGKPPPNKGSKMPDHVKEILMSVNKGRPSWNKGKKMSEEARRNNSLSKKGLMVGEKHPMWGTKMPDYVKEALRKANENREPWNKGYKMTPEQVIEHTKKREKQMKSVLMFDLNGVLLKEFSSLCSAARELGVSKGTLSNACYKRDRLKTFKGYIWEFKNPLQ